jgi:DNA-binding NarL/FixJ family response regulator
MTTRQHARLIELPQHHVDVLTLIARGRDMPAIAKQLNLTVNVVRTVWRECLLRLGADNAAHAVALAIGLDLLPADVATGGTDAR